MSALDALSGVLLVCGGFFFVAGTAGVLRFPDSLARLHALTKADNVGLAFVAAALAIESGSGVVALKLVLTWLLVLLASSSACYLLARHLAEGADDDGG